MRMGEDKQIRRILKERVMVLDGAMGSLIRNYDLTEEDFRGDMFAGSGKDQKDNFEALNLTRPEIIKEIHTSYLKAGADIIETNTFNGSEISLADWGLEEYAFEINKTAARLAREAVTEFSQKSGRACFVAGVLGPTNKSVSLSPGIDHLGFRTIRFDDLVLACKQQGEALMEGGADLLMIETVFNILNAKAALLAVEEVFDKLGRSLPLMVSVTITDTGGRIRSGQNIEAFLNSISNADLLSIGINCAPGARGMKPFLRELSEKAPFFVSAHPNAGMPNPVGEYDQTPERMSKEIKGFLDEKLVNIIGGCCGTTPDHIFRFAELAAKAEARQVPVT